MPLIFIVLVSVVSLCLCLWRWSACEERCSGDLSRVKAPLVLFDFDGTLCPSFDLLVREFNAVSGYYGLKKVEPHEVEALRDMGAKKVQKVLGISTFKLPFVVKKICRNASTHIVELEPVLGISEVLNALKMAGYSLGILSSNSEENIRIYLEKYDLDFFDFIYTGNAIFSKKRYLDKIRKLSGVDTISAYVGDEVRDMEAAQDAYVPGIAVSWGFNSIKKLKESFPENLCETPEKLIEMVERLAGASR